MTLAHRDDTLQLARDLNEDGFRVIAVAHKDMPAEQTVYGVADERELTLIGFIAFLDPPKESAAPALAALESHGIKVKILTGDNDIVAKRICKDVNLTVEGILLGSDLEHMTDEDLAQKVEHRLCSPSCRRRRRRASLQPCIPTGMSSVSLATASMTALL